MPQLPEAETIKEDLRGLVVSSRILRAEVLDTSLVEQPSAEEFVRRIAEVRISGARRRAKHIILDLENGDSLDLQLKLAGQLLLVSPVEVPESAVMLIFHLDDERQLYLRDELRLTRARLFGPGELEEGLSDLGPDPLEESFSVEYLRQSLGGRRSRIKPLLMEQRLVAGIGNIYADEILYDARIHPRRKASTLSTDECRALHTAIQENLEAGIEHRGTTVQFHRDLLNRPGEHQDYLRVFERGGQPCPECGGKVAQEQVGGRTTYYCPECQIENGSWESEQLSLM
ncbi:bifunctional DNA-formamidopyrimidine glycosylase/DNA-(apurinic or apyrimidinic site) lyase [soil metagenome]